MSHYNSKGRITCHNHGCKNQFKGFCTINLKCGLCVDYSDKDIERRFTEAEVDELKRQTLMRHNVSVERLYSTKEDRGWMI